MRLLGRITHLGSKGGILKARVAPKVGQPVFNSKKKRIGNVYDLFGPVKSPYVIIKPASGISAESLLGVSAYVMEERRG